MSARGVSFPTGSLRGSAQSQRTGGEGRIEQVLDNLLANALEVAPAGTTIDLTAERSDGSAEIRVGDRGPGMSRQELARAFDRFWRAGTDKSGFGFGLAIVQRLIHADGGEIELRPREAGGLEAIVRLPPASGRPNAAESQGS